METSRLSIALARVRIRLHVQVMRRGLQRGENERINTRPGGRRDGTPGAATPDFTHAMGYSYADDPYFMYCAEDMENMDAANWWLPSCDLSGGSSGGPWLQPFTGSAGSSDVISVNSWGYTTSPGMAGPKLYGTSAHCVYTAARIESATGTADGDEGFIATCSN